MEERFKDMTSYDRAVRISLYSNRVNRVAQKVTSTDIKLALKEFHNGKPSYFITECKTCSTYFPDPQGLLKFDGLAITKSYTKLIDNIQKNNKIQLEQERLEGYMEGEKWAKLEYKRETAEKEDYVRMYVMLYKAITNRLR